MRKRGPKAARATTKRMFVVSYSSEKGGRITVAAKSGWYEYANISPYIYAVIRRLKRHGRIGDIWQLLKRHPVRKICIKCMGVGCGECNRTGYLVLEGLINATA